MGRCSGWLLFFISFVYFHPPPSYLYNFCLWFFCCTKCKLICGPLTLTLAPKPRIETKRTTQRNQQQRIHKTMSTRSKVLLVGPTHAGKEGIISSMSWNCGIKEINIAFASRVELSSKTASDSSFHSSVKILPWEIDTKYYSAEVDIWMHNSDIPLTDAQLQELGSECEALILVFDLHQVCAHMCKSTHTHAHAHERTCAYQDTHTPRSHLSFSTLAPIHAESFFWAHQAMGWVCGRARTVFAVVCGQCGSAYTATATRFVCVSACVCVCLRKEDEMEGGGTSIFFSCFLSLLNSLSLIIIIVFLFCDSAQNYTTSTKRGA